MCRNQRSLQDLLRCGSLLLLGGLVMWVHVTMADSPLDTPFYEPGGCTDLGVATACNWEQSIPDTGVYNMTHVLPPNPIFGYPCHYTLIKGINDTLQAIIEFHNLRNNAYDLTGKDYEHWFAPQVYDPYLADSGTVALLDSTKLSYKVRGWYSSTIRHSAQTKLPAHASWYGIKLDIWGLPQGHYQICILPTNRLPADFTPLVSGETFEFYPAYSLADSCNAYEGCFWNAWHDSNFVGADKCVDKIMNINANSVPGWWLRAHNALSKRDTLVAKSAFDNAINSLTLGADPAMPDSTKRALTSVEKNYLHWLNFILPYYRAQLGP